MNSSNLHIEWARLFVDSLAASGVEWIVVSPGARSMPLALAALESDRLRVQIAIDERSGGFFGLGVARATGRPAALLCTSGTAGAHYFPAVMEASASFLPLVVVTADRPWEAQDCAAPQTIDQTKMFGAHVRHAFELGAPNPMLEALRAVTRIAAQAVATARHPLPGPVHINAHFRKPLEPLTDPPPLDPATCAEIDRLRSMGPSRITIAAAAVSLAALDSLERSIRNARRGLIVAGPAWVGEGGLLSATGREVRERGAAGVAELAKATGFPLLAEATSGFRAGAALGGFDAFLRDERFRREHVPDFILQLGGTPISPGLSEWLLEIRVPLTVVAPHGWHDPDGIVSEHIAGHPGNAAFEIVARLAERPHCADAAWTAAFERAESASIAAAASVAASAQLSEAQIARAVAEALPEGGWIFAGNGRAVRDLDSFVPPSATPLTILHQRGVSGIDGLIAGAAGVSRSSDLPGIALIGDVGFLHDLGGLSLARETTAPLAIVVIDNGGGRIFDELPIAKQPALQAARETLLLTAPRIDFAHAAATFGVKHARSDCTATLSQALVAALATPGCTIVQAIVTDQGVPRETLFRKTSEALR